MLIKRPLADGTTEVTFRVPALEGVSRLNLLGDFNQWNADAHPLAQDSDGTWSVALTLAAGDYGYRYLANGGDWLNDSQADAYVPNEFGGNNSLVHVEAVAAEAPVAEPAPKKKRAAKPKAAKAGGGAVATPKKRATRKKTAE